MDSHLRFSDGSASVVVSDAVLTSSDTFKDLLKISRGTLSFNIQKSQGDMN